MNEQKVAMEGKICYTKGVMKKGHKIDQQSPWLMVSIGIMGLITGYAFMLASKGELKFEAANRCPMQHMHERAV